ncbi:hypothetical protein MNBD_NITROSPINAE03-420 [hydrothermal vent metagenome]|uniref:DUF2079 domain-containing protein n=1 Tax=hydrothermal vent metagenome TaxID=652676 RepID=A0A3B1BWI5_9ZZZZ
MQSDFKSSLEADKSTIVRLILALFVVSFISWFTYHSIDNWSAMFTSLDFAHIDSAAYNTAHGKFMYSNAKMINFFSEHITPVLLVVSGFYLFSDGYWFIFFFQSFMLGLAAVPLFLVARYLLKNEWAALFIALGYLANGKVQLGALADYHMWSCTAFFLFSAFYAMLVRRWGWYALFSILLLSVKEDAPALLLGLGLYAALVMKAYRQAFYTWLLCALAAAVSFMVVFPALRYWDDYKYATYYGWLGDGAIDIALNFISSPLEMIGKLTQSGARIKAWYSFSLQYGFLPFLSPTGMAILFLPSMELFLSNYWRMYGLNFHYPLLVVPVWTLAAILGLKNIATLARKIRLDKEKIKLVIIIPAAYMLAANVWLSKYEGAMPFISNPSWKITQDNRRHARIARKLISMIPKTATISAHDGPYNFLTHRPNAYLYHGDREGHSIVEFYRGKQSHGYELYPFTKMPIDYIVLDVKAPGGFRRKYHPKDVADLNGQKDYELWKNEDGIYVYKRKGAK